MTDFYRFIKLDKILNRGWTVSVPAPNLGTRIYIGTRTNPFLADACRAPGLKSLCARRKISVPRAPGHPLISSPAFQKWQTIFIEFHKISKIFDLVSIISIWQIMLLLYLVSILYLFKISIFYMKINLTTAIHWAFCFTGDPASLRLYFFFYKWFNIPLWL